MAYATWQYRNWAKEYNIRYAVKESHGVSYMEPVVRLFELEVQARSATSCTDGRFPTSTQPCKPSTRPSRTSVTNTRTRRLGRPRRRSWPPRSQPAETPSTSWLRGTGQPPPSTTTSSRRAGIDARARPAARHVQHNGLDHEPRADRDGQLGAGARPGVADRSREGGRPREPADPAHDPAGQHLVGRGHDRRRVRRHVRRHGVVRLPAHGRRVTPAARPLGRIGDQHVGACRPRRRVERERRAARLAGPDHGNTPSASPACPRSTSCSPSASARPAVRNTPCTRSSRSVPSSRPTSLTGIVRSVSRAAGNLEQVLDAAAEGGFDVRGRRGGRGRARAHARVGREDARTAPARSTRPSPATRLPSRTRRTGSPRSASQTMAAGAEETATKPELRRPRARR